MKHGEPVTGPVEGSMADERGAICVLLRDGRLFGPFRSTGDARYWTVSQGLPGFSTYALLSPTEGPADAS